MFTLTEIKKIIYLNTTSPRNIPFLTTFMPSVLYANPNPNLNIHLTDCDYESIGSWLSNLMNGKTKSNGNLRVSRSGVDRVRKQLFSILLKEENIIHDMEINFRTFINHSSINLPDLEQLVQDASDMDIETKNHLISCLHNSASHGLSLLFLCALLPDYTGQLTKLKGWYSIYSFTRIPRNSQLHIDILNLQENLTKLLSTLKENFGLDEEQENSCLDQLNRFDSLLNLYILKLPPDIHTAFKNMLESAKTIYYEIYNNSNISSSYPTRFVYNLQQIAKLQQNYNLLCQGLSEAITDNS